MITKSEEWDCLYTEQLLPVPVSQTTDEAVVWVNELVEKIAKA